MPAGDTAAALQQASEGLTYQSETDARWAAFHWPNAAGEPTAAGVRRRGHHRASAAVEEQTVEEFFAPLVEEQDWCGDDERVTAGKYRTLWDAVSRLLAGPKVFRVGATRVTIYVVGAVADGGWAGVKTTAVETG